ncbi:MAG: diaminopimelate decarboxylase, partial [Pseudomonadota bacterium]
YALDENIHCFNVESEPELERLSALASARGATASIAIRVNPDVDAKTHAKISTGKSENKFGVPISRAREVYARAAALPGIRVSGVDMHIGSQITDLARGFADAGKGDFGCRNTGGAGTTQFAFRDDIHTCAKFREGFEYGLVRIRLHRVADKGIDIGKGTGEDAVMALERGG